MSWQDSLQLAAVLGPVLGVAAGATWWCVRRHLRDLWARINRLQKQVSVLTDEKEGWRRKSDRALLRLTESDRRVADLRDRLRRIKQLFLPQLEHLRKRIVAVNSGNERLRARLRDLEALAGQGEAQRAQLQGEKERLEKELRTSAATEARLRAASEEPVEQIEALNGQVEELRARVRRLEGELRQKDLCLDQREKEVCDLRAQLHDLETPKKGAVEQNGRVWERPFGAEAVPFRPLADRGMPIISVVNLKGGVGKTTITANLGATLAAQGSRVLLVDLDYQRSLTLLCCPPGDIKKLHGARHTLQHFLSDPRAGADRLLACASPVDTAGGCQIVINTDPLESEERGDNLEEVEMHLLADWLTDPDAADIRLILRNALHAPSIREHFDYVLLDCPPRLSTACINALAASDFALVPVLLDYPSANSAYNLLRKLRRLRDRDVLPDLAVLGVLANRVKLHGVGLKKSEADVWDKLHAPCQLAWEAPVHFFKTVIKQDAVFADAAERRVRGRSERTFAAQYKKLTPVFDKLVQELTERIEHERAHLAAVS